MTETDVVVAEKTAPVADVKVVYDMEKPLDAEGCIQIEAKKNGMAGSIWYDFGSDLADMTDKFGEAVIFSSARAHMKVKLQSNMRAYLMAGTSLKELAAKYVPGIALERTPVNMEAATETYFTALSDEEQDAMISRLMAKKA